MANSRVAGRSPSAQILRSPHAWLIVFSWLGLVLAGIRDTSPIFYPYRWWFIALLAISLLGILTRIKAVRYCAEHRCLLAYLAVAALSCAVSLMPEYSFARWCTLLLMFIAVFIGAWSFAQWRQHFRLLVNLAVASVCIGAIFSSWYILEAGQLIPQTRFTGAFGKATGAGSFAAASIPLILWRLRYSSGWTKVFFGSVFGILLYMLFFSGGRAAIVGGLFAVTIWTWKHAQGLRPAMAAGTFFLVFLTTAGVLTLDMPPEYIIRRETLPTFSGRIPLWKVGISLFLESPVIGHGYGMTRYIRKYSDYEEHLEGKIVPVPVRFLDLIPGFGTAPLGRATLHSDHVERLVETGLLGYVPFALLWYFILRRIAAVFWLPATPDSSLAMALGLNVSYVFLDSFMHGALFALNAPGVLLAWVAIVMFMRASELAVVGCGYRACTSSTLSTASIRGPVVLATR